MAHPNNQQKWILYLEACVKHIIRCCYLKGHRPRRTKTCKIAPLSTAKQLLRLEECIQHIIRRRYRKGHRPRRTKTCKIAPPSRAKQLLYLEACVKHIIRCCYLKDRRPGRRLFNTTLLLAHFLGLPDAPALFGLCVKHSFSVNCMTLPLTPSS